MLIGDSEKFALVIPTHEGTAFLRRCLEYLESLAYPGQIALCDDSSGAHLQFVRSCIERYPALRLETFFYPHPTRFLVKLADTLQRLSARYILLCAHDDFVMPAAVEQIIELLEARPELSAARGRIARFHIERKQGTAGDSVAVQPLRHPQRSYLEDDATERVLGHLREYSPTLYSVHRRSFALENFRATEAATQNVMFFQYLSSSITAQQGKIDCIEELYLARQAHAGSWAARLQSDYEHFPLLLSSPRYSTYYLEFRAALTRRLAPAAENPAALGEGIDAAYLSLLRRSLCLAEAASPPDEAFFARLATRGSRENGQLQQIVDFVLRHPGTY
jgi:glycosyltransferase domain-containing protein